MQIGHETTDACIGKKPFFTKQCQTYPKYEQCLQKLGTYLENKVLSKLSLIQVGLLIKHPSQIFFGMILPIFDAEKWLC